MNKILFTAFAIGIFCAGPIVLPALSAETAKPASPTPAHPPQPAAPAYDEQAEAEYQHCLKLATTRPDDGYEEALAWGSMGGGEAALHCGAIARIGQKQYADGAKRLEKLSRESHRPDAIRAQMLAQAAQAWVLDGNYDQANTDQVAALAIDPDNADIRVDHAVTLGQVHHYKEALAELDKVLQTQS
jgi:tetratricopeptide (TPR) repeat protein